MHIGVIDEHQLTIEILQKRIVGEADIVDACDVLLGVSPMLEERILAKADLVEGIQSRETVAYVGVEGERVALERCASECDTCPREHHAGLFAPSRRYWSHDVPAWRFSMRRLLKLFM